MADGAADRAAESIQHDYSLQIGSAGHALITNMRQAVHTLVILTVSSSMSINTPIYLHSLAVPTNIASDIHSIQLRCFARYGMMAALAIPPAIALGFSTDSMGMRTAVASVGGEAVHCDEVVYRNSCLAIAMEEHDELRALRSQFRALPLVPPHLVDALPTLDYGGIGIAIDTEARTELVVQQLRREVQTQWESFGHRHIRALQYTVAEWMVTAGTPWWHEVTQKIIYTDWISLR